jgi:hypothetical protein
MTPATSGAPAALAGVSVPSDRNVAVAPPAIARMARRAPKRMASTAVPTAKMRTVSDMPMNETAAGRQPANAEDLLSSFRSEKLLQLSTKTLQVSRVAFPHSCPGTGNVHASSRPPRSRRDHRAPAPSMAVSAAFPGRVPTSRAFGLRSAAIAHAIHRITNHLPPIVAAAGVFHSSRFKRGSPHEVFLRPTAGLVTVNLVESNMGVAPPQARLPSNGRCIATLAGVE